MDAVEFLKELKRRCKANPKYYGEELLISDIDPVTLVAQVENWSKEFPAKTRQTEFLKQFPDVRMKNGYINIKPCELVSAFYIPTDCENTTCEECKRQYWSCEVK